MSTSRPQPEETSPWNVEKLRLDPKNPRLAETLEDATQRELRQALYNSYDLEPLLLSMFQHGYFSEEPLIGVRDTDEEIVIVVEGNRRLAALQLLLFDWAREEVGESGLLETSGLLDVSETILAKLNPVPVKIYPSRDDIVPYLGVRHIRGVKDWDPLAKARYVSWLIEKGESANEVARSIGVQRGTVRRWLLTLHVLEQANKASEITWDYSPSVFKFSWLYTSLGYARVRDYLDLVDPKQSDPEPQPVPQEKIPFLLDHMRDLYGPAPGDSQQAKVRDSRNLRQLAAVYDSREAVDILRGGASLEEAYSRSSGEEEELLVYLRQVNFNLQRALGIGHRHKDNAEINRLATQANKACNILLKNLSN